MRVVVVYRPDSEYARIVEEFVRDYEVRHGSKGIEMLNVDGQEGSAIARLYDVMQYPAILALREDGQLLKSWEGGELPLMDEVAAYAYA
ncbi:MAG TPA: hypothetical protein VFN56_05455 [Candidatus Saccharimonadales bacterium]|nr:hypothetical protein [Candidatus Saccharimonadales bacterium]